MVENVEKGAVADRLHETLRAYVSASNAALRTFVDYKTGHATDRAVTLANRAERVALDAHIAAIEETRR